MTRQRPLVFVTDRNHPAGAPDDRLLYDELRRDGLDLRLLAWDDDHEPLEAGSLVVFRSPWSYHTKLEQFGHWLERLEAQGHRILNDPATVRWNLHKRYLVELAQRGLPVVPTELCPRRTRATEGESLTSLLQRRGWDEVVIKPAISATARGTWRSSAASASKDAERFVEHLVLEELLVQPFCASIVGGELSVVFLDGRYSHAVRKIPETSDFRVQAQFGGRVEAFEPTPKIVQEATSILAARKPAPPYARIDGVVEDGHFLLMEAELFEPELFLRTSPEALGRFARRLRELASEQDQGGNSPRTMP